MKLKSAFSGVVALSLLTAATAFAQKTPVWRLELETQLIKEIQCDMLYATNAFETKRHNKTQVSGRAHCRDGRRFDFSRMEGDVKFKFKNCDPVVC